MNEVNAMSKQGTMILQKFAVVYPSGNTTAVVFDQLLGSDREALNEAIMTAWKVQSPEQREIEQCCFVTRPNDERAIARVEMFGGEFCVNAARSVIEVLTEDHDEGSGYIEVSGATEILYYTKSGGLIALKMPEIFATNLRNTQEGSIVDLGGIAQLVVTNPERRAAQSPCSLLSSLLDVNAYGLADKLAVGVSYFDEISSEAQFAVWVRDVNTIFDETACGSGTTAIAACMFLDPSTESGLRAGRANRLTETKITQPSGETITATTSWGRRGRFAKDAMLVTISGKTTKLYGGRLALS